MRVSDRGLAVHDAFRIRLRHRLERRLEKTKTEN